jgi:hypothetical protein
MKYFLAFAILIAAHRITAQDNSFFTITGTVTDATTGQVLSGASVFCQNTTVGTVSKADGSFSLRLPNGGYELIVSYTGYQTFEQRINSNNTAAISVNLKARDKSLDEVAVVASNEVADGLAKYGSFFSNEFIGTTANASKCRIKNPEALQFFFNKKKNRLKVRAKEELVIVNEALGYRIKYQLDSFVYEYNTNISIYTGFPFYEEMSSDSVQQQQWRQNRRKAYFGSRMHFMRCWYNNSLNEQGFVLEKPDTGNTAALLPFSNPYDTSIYQRGETKEVEIFYKGKLRVVYKNEIPDEDYIKRNKLPDGTWSQTSLLQIEDGLVIEENGFFYDQNEVSNSGYWAWEKLADAVPYTFSPTQ